VAFAFLIDIIGEFHNKYGSKFEIASRPYEFIEFDKDIQNSQKKYTVIRWTGSRVYLLFWKEKN